MRRVPVRQGSRPGAPPDEGRSPLLVDGYDGEAGVGDFGHRQQRGHPDGGDKDGPQAGATEHDDLLTRWSPAPVLAGMPGIRGHAVSRMGGPDSPALISGR